MDITNSFIYNNKKMANLYSDFLIYLWSFYLIKV